MPSASIWRRCARSNGSSTASGRSAGPRRCWHICRATPTASRQGPVAAEGHDAGDGRVHPPLPHPRAAQRLPPHPALRPVRQWWARREPGPRPRRPRSGSTHHDADHAIATPGCFSHVPPISNRRQERSHRCRINPVQPWRLHHARSRQILRHACSSASASASHPPHSILNPDYTTSANATFPIARSTTEWNLARGFLP